MARVTGGSVRTHRQTVTLRIFEAVEKLLYERGYDAISLADVAEAADMSRTSMYNYFPDKASLVIAYATYETEQFVAELDEGLRRVSNPVEQMRVYIRKQLEYFSSHHLPPGPALRLLMPEDASHDVLAHVRDLESRLEGIVIGGVERRYLEADDIAVAVELISACITRGNDLDLDLEARIAATETFVLRALGARIGDDGTIRKIPRR